MSSSDEIPARAPAGMRLQRYLARCGVASRRHSEALITQGRVAVNGEIVTELGTRVDGAIDIVKVDGKQVTVPDVPMYLLLHKPLGYVTTMSDPQGRPTVAEFLPPDEGLFPVGRLDMDTSGALILTSDGDLGHKLMHPSFHASKTYRAKVRGIVSPDDARTLASGIMLEDGMTHPADVEIVEGSPPNSVVRITLREGRNRQVRRMFEHIDHPVIELHRESIGPIDISGLAPGEIRALEDSEVQALRVAVGLG